MTTEHKTKPSLEPAIAINEHFVIKKAGLKRLVEGISESMKVVGVKSKDGRFVFDDLRSFEELRLDYDVTVYPPTRYLRPPRETLVKFKAGALSEPVLEAAPTAIIGVHPYDIKAIELLDQAFIGDHPDPNYVARRRNTVIIGSDILTPSPNSFARSMGTSLTDSGFDLMLTDLGQEYMVEVGSRKGAELLNKYAQVAMPTPEQIARQKMVRDKAASRYQLALKTPREKLPGLLEDNWDSPYWKTKAESCLSCGSCITTCPTCFCFDVKDEMALNLKEGERLRTWDGCTLADFARVASGENFRHDRASRLRHRIMRKGKYMVDKYGTSGCVGCGRCATACLPGVASPLDAFNAFADLAGVGTVTAQMLRDAKPETDLYVPRPATLVNTDVLTPKEKVLEIQMVDGKRLGHRPGQFVEVSIDGIGEAPISVSSSPSRSNGTFQLAVRKLGDVTGALHNLVPGANLGIRGPFGNGFPLEKLQGKDILFVAGGIGLFPLRSLVQYVLDNRGSYGRAIMLFGSRSPSERPFLDELAVWSKAARLEFHETVDKGNAEWKGNVGVITTLFPRISFDARNTMAVVVGPPVMYRFVIGELKKRDVPDENVVVSLERRMKCGVGKCGHCQINGVYVCRQGPVFTLDQLRKLREAI